jgi:hypothetical protein
MQSKDLQTEIATLKLQMLDLERNLDQAFSRNLELKETKKIYHELKLAKEKLTRLTELYDQIILLPEQKFHKP